MILCILLYYYIILYYIILYYIILYYIILYYIILCYVMLCYAMLCYANYIILYYIILYYIILYYIILHYIILYETDTVQMIRFIDFTCCQFYPTGHSLRRAGTTILMALDTTGGLVRVPNGEISQKIRK